MYQGTRFLIELSLHGEVGCLLFDDILLPIGNIYANIRIQRTNFFPFGNISIKLIAIPYFIPYR